MAHTQHISNGHHGHPNPHDRSKIPIIAFLSHPDKSVFDRTKKAFSACSACPMQFFRQIQQPKPIRNHAKV